MVSVAFLTSRISTVPRKLEKKVVLNGFIHDSAVNRPMWSLEMDAMKKWPRNKWDRSIRWIVGVFIVFLLVELALLACHWASEFNGFDSCFGMAIPLNIGEDLCGRVWMRHFNVVGCFSHFRSFLLYDCLVLSCHSLPHYSSSSSSSANLPSHTVIWGLMCGYQWFVEPQQRTSLDVHDSFSINILSLVCFLFIWIWILNKIWKIDCQRTKSLIDENDANVSRFVSKSTNIEMKVSFYLERISMME